MSEASSCNSPLAILLALISKSSLSSECIAVLQSSTTRTHDDWVAYLATFLLTCALEAPIYFAAGKLLKRPWKELLPQIVILNLATHPIVYWLMPYLCEQAQLNYLTFVVIAESFAPAVEALLLRFWAKYPWRWAIGASLIANLCSWGIGVWLKNLT